MKRILMMAVLALVTMTVSPVFAADGGKDECLLESQKCKDQVDTLQQKIKKLNEAVKKGKATYSPEELKKLQQKLQDAIDEFDTIQGRKGGNA